MVSAEQYGTNDPLQRAAAALRDAPVPDGPPLQIVTSTIDALQSSDTSSDLAWVGERRKLMFRVARYGGIAAAVTLLATATAWFFLIDRSAGMAFAEVAENVKTATTVSYAYRGKADNKPLAAHKKYVAGDQMRLEYESGGSHVIDLGRKKGLILNPEKRIAFTYPIDEKTAAWARNRISQLLTLLESKDARRVGSERINGREVVAYRVNLQETNEALWAYAGAVNTVWVDPKTKLPARVEIRWPDGSFDLYDEFTWNEQFKPDLFQFHIPKGYTVKTAEERLKEMSKDTGAKTQ